MGEKEGVKRRGLAKKHASLDYEVWQWKTNLENSRGVKRVTKAEVQAYALEAYRKAGITNFKASDGWYRRWRARWQNSSAFVNKDVDKQEGNEFAEKESEIHFTTVTTTVNTPRKRKSSDFKSICPEEKVKIRTENCNTKTDGKPFVEERHQEICGETETLMVSSVNKDQPHVCSENEENKVLSIVTMKNTLPIEPCPTSNLDPLIVSVDFLKLKKSKKRLKSTHSNTEDTLEISTVCNSSISTLLSNSNNCNKNADISVCNRTQLDVNASCETVKTTDFQKVALVKASEQDTVFLTQNDDIIKDLVENTIGIIETSREVDSRTVESRGTANVCFAGDSPICSQSDSGISVSVLSGSLESADSLILSPIFEQSEIDFSENEHELFCDSCDDFHPRQKCSHSGCKQIKETRNNFLLTSVFEKKQVIPNGPSHPTVKSMKDCTKNCDTIGSQLNNPSVSAPKGKRYLVQFKSKVINYALNSSVTLAAEKFKVNRNTVAEWLAERNRCSANIPLKHVDQDVAGDSDFLTWLEESKFNLTNELVKAKTLEWLQNSQSSTHRSQWLRMYASRLNGTEDIACKKRYIVYPDAFKRAVVFHAQTHSNMAAARVFGVARKRIIEWQQHTGEVKETSKYTNASNVTDEVVDVQVYEWYCQQQPAPTSKQVRNKAVELYRAAGHSDIQCSTQWYYRWRARHKLLPSRDQLYTSMTPLLIWTLTQLDNNKCVSQSALAAQAALLGHKKVSRGWTFRFCKKYNALLQTLPAPETPLPYVLEQQVSEFKEKLHNVISTRSVTEDRIIAMDEIPLHFLPKDKARKPMLVRRPGFEACQASLMVTCRADGTLLPTVLVFKGSGPEANRVSDHRVIAFANDTAQISDDMMQNWLSSVCFPHMKEEGVVVLDSFDVHVSPEVSQSLASRNIHIAVTPPGCAARLLPITPFCHSFKTMLEDSCQVWLSSQTAVLESPSPDQLYPWAVRAHKSIAKQYQEKIRSSFKNMILPQTGPVSEQL